MPTLKGQNLRIIADSAVVAMATNCTINLTTNTEESSTKDDVGMASKPSVVSNGWNVQVESMDVTDIATLLTAIKSNHSFLVVWDETSGAHNATPAKAALNRAGYAYISDFTASFNDRENSVKNIQFTGSGPIQHLANITAAFDSPEVFTKGQFVRLFLSSDNSTVPAKVIAAAKTLQLHVTTQLESATTKDTDGDWEVQEPVAISYDITTDALVRSGDTITSAVLAQDLASLESIYEGAVPVKFLIANVSGDNQRTKGSVIMSGSVILSQLAIQAQNRQNATYTATLTGYGDYTVGA